MEFNVQTLSTDAVRQIAGGEVAVESAVSDAESGGIQKILTVAADARVLSAEAVNGIAEVTGRVNFKLAYTDKNGEPGSIDYFNDFTDRLETGESSGNIYATVAVTDADATLNGGAVLTAVVSIKVYTIDKENLSCLTEADEACYTEKGTLALSRYVTSVRHTVDLNDQIETGTSVDKILLFDNSAVITDINVGVENMLVSGEAVSVITYTADGKIVSEQLIMPFSEEIAAPSLAMGQKAYGCATVKQAKIILSGVEGGNVIRAELGVELEIRVFACEEQQFVSDIFSTECELEKTMTSLNVKLPLGSASFKRKVTGQVSLDSDMPAVREVIAVAGASNNVASVVINGISDTENDKLNITIEGIVNACILYSDENGLNSVNAEIPYSETFALSGDMKNATSVTACGIVCDAEARARRDKEIEFSAKLVITADAGESKCVNVIGAIAEGEKKAVNDCTLSIYVAEEGDGIWDAAKALCARPDSILSQNPAVVFPLKGGEKIKFMRKAAVL